MNAISKVFYLLDQFTEENPQWRVRDLSAKLGLTPNLTHWYLKHLEQLHVIRKDPVSDNYELGFKILELGNRRSTYTVVKTISLPILRELSAKTRSTTVLKVLEGDEFVCLVAVESPSSLRVHYSEGSRSPCTYGCIGKLFTAYLDKKQLKRVVSKVAARNLAKASERTRIRKQGWASSSGEAIDGDALEGVQAIAAPVRGASGDVFAGVAAIFPAISSRHLRTEDVAKQVLKAADEISRQLGWKPEQKHRVNGLKR
jgi:DNA-binding IclR family transcriptional regulator